MIKYARAMSRGMSEEIGEADMGSLRKVLKGTDGAAMWRELRRLDLSPTSQVHVFFVGVGLVWLFLLLS